MTGRQTAYLAALVAERPEALRAAAASTDGRTAAQAGWLQGYAAGRYTAADLTVRAASEAISFLLALPRDTTAAPAPANAAPDVRQGRYAIVAADGTVKFYKVDRPTEGRWAGRTFVKVQASDEWHPVRERHARSAILAAIAADPEGAMRRYGLELGRCGNCGRTLTDETSRAMGIGPDCAQALGLDRSPYAEAARREMVERVTGRDAEREAAAEQEIEGAVVAAEEQAAADLVPVQPGSQMLASRRLVEAVSPAAAMTVRAREARLTWRERQDAVAEQQDAPAAPTVYQSRLRQAAAAVAGKQAPFTLYIDGDAQQFADGTAAYLTGMAAWQRGEWSRVTIVDATSDLVVEWDF